MNKINLTCSNIRFENINDENQNWPKRKKLLSSIILDFETHLLGTQEGRKDQLFDLESLLNLKLIDSHRNWIDERMYPTIYINTDIFSVIASGDIWLSKTPNIVGSKDFNSTFPRLVTWAKLKIKNTNTEFFYFNMHLDHLSEDTRVEQLKVFCQESEKLISPSDNFIISGDFNSGPNSNARKVLEDHFKDGLFDPWIKLKLPEETSYHHFEGENFENGERIDWILLSKEFNCSEITFNKKKSGQIFSSDHYPLQAIIQI